MSQQMLGLRRPIQIVRRHKILTGTMVALGLLGGGAYAAVNPPLVTSTALVLLPQAGDLDRAERMPPAAMRPIPIRKLKR